MKRFYLVSTICCLLLMITATVAYATPLFGDNNLTASDIEIQQKKASEKPLPMDEAIKKYNKNKEISNQQKAQANQKVLEQIIQGAKTSPGSIETPPEFEAKMKEIESKKNEDLVFSTATVVKSWYLWPNYTQADGGSGIGWSGSKWAAADDIRNGSRAELYGDYWATTSGWDYYTPSTTGNYNVASKFYVYGRLLSGSSLAVRVKVTDTTNGQTVTRTIFNPSPGYFDGTEVNVTEQFYLTAGHKYAFTFETETSSGALVTATLSDFYEKEFTGNMNQRKIYFWSIIISK